MNENTAPRVHRVTALITSAAIVFCLFFQINKGGPFREINPFGQDPYDAVGSFAIQAALLVGILTYARALRLRHDPAQAPKLRLIVRGNVLVLFVILMTLAADATAEIFSPLAPSFWGNVLIAELALMYCITLASAIALARVCRRIEPAALPGHLTPADGIDDLWTLARVPVTKAHDILPKALVDKVMLVSSDWLFARAPWLDPRRHPWRFACALGLLVGVALVAAQLQEGLPPSLKTGLLVTGIFIGAEMTATLVGFALLGGYLGLRPSLRRSA